MMSSLAVRRLIAKDLYLYRWLMLAATVGGIGAIVLSGFDGAAGTTGEILFATVVVAHGVFLAIHSPLMERQSRSILFILSMPISPLQYTAAKVVSCMVAFLIPWAILLATIFGLTAAFGSESTLQVPLLVTTMIFLLANYSVLLSVGLTSRSEMAAVAGILATNTMVPVFLGAILPRITGGDAGSWSGAIISTIVVLIVVIAGALILPMIVQSRRKDFV